MVLRWVKFKNSSFKLNLEASFKLVNGYTNNSMLSEFLTNGNKVSNQQLNEKYRRKKKLKNND